MCDFLLRKSRSIAKLCVGSILAVLAVEGTAQAESRIRICSQTAREVVYAYALEEVEEGLTTTGWYRLTTGDCSSWITTNSRNLYVSGHTNALAWQGPDQLCVDHERPTGFSITHADTTVCDGIGQGHEGFQKLALTDGDNTFYLNDSSATRIGYTLNVCNRTDETINLALGVEVAEGIYSDGWYAVDSEKCRVFEETGKFEVAYINANTPGNLQEWMGTTPLCVSWNKPFYLANTLTSLCEDGDSKNRGFIKIPLTAGEGHYDLLTANAVNNSVGINLCNNANFDIYAAYVATDTIPANGLIANGWIHIRPNECLLAGAAQSGPVYLYAEDSDGFEIWDGTDMQACIHDYKAFTIPLAETVACTNPGQSRRGFKRWDVSPGANVYTFH